MKSVTKYVLGLILVIFLVVILRIIKLFYVRKTIRNLLVKLINEFEKEDVKYWVDFGSLLGIMREKDVIFGDNDGDVCILHSDDENTEKVQNIVQRMDGKKFDWGAFRVYNGDIFIDIYIVKDDNPEFNKFTDLIQPIIKKDVSLGNLHFVASLPNNSSQLLEKRYGKNWMIPVYKWYFLYF